jgi:hypothetical protein
MPGCSFTFTATIRKLLEALKVDIGRTEVIDNCMKEVISF